MGDIEQLLRYEVANSAVAFRERPYGEKQKQEFLRDILGLANAETKGPRYLVLGVRDAVGGRRHIVGVAEDDAAGIHDFARRLVHDFVEPAVDLRVDERRIDDKRIVTLLLPDCADPPYLLKRNASASMRVGSGWIRRGTKIQRLNRADMQRIFETKLLSHGASAEIRVGFAGRLLEHVLHLPVMPLGQRPSDVASAKLRQMLAAQEVVERHGAAERSRMQRLVHAQLFGLERAYQPDGKQTLLERLERVGEDHAAEDRYYEFEQRAHKVNLVIENVGRAPFEDGTIVLDFPRMDGVVVVERLWPPPGGKASERGVYPAVDAGARTVRVQAMLAAIPPGSKGMAFLESLRLCVREQAAGEVVPISYTLYGRGLRASLSGALRIQIEDLARPEAAIAINQ